MGRVKVLGFAYRQWAREILFNLSQYRYIEMNKEKDPMRVTESVMHNANPDLILFYGWSWNVPDWITEHYVVLGLHPSPLPKYRGGSPIQNQIMNGEEESSVSIFRMTKDVDAGPLCAQVAFSLTGNMQDILKRIIKIGTDETSRIISDHINGGIKYWPQEGEGTYCHRRHPFQSEITWDELKSMPADYIYNKIRCLQDPYPNAYINCADGKRLYLTEAHCG